MKRLQIVIVILIVVLLATALGLLSLLKMAREFPASRPGLAMFHIGYERTADKSQFLMNYQTRLIQHNGYHIPPPVDQFLIGRLAVAAPGSDEAMAIIKFYRRTPANRWACLGKSNDSLKKTLISQLLADQDDDMPPEICWISINHARPPPPGGRPRVIRAAGSSWLRTASWCAWGFRASGSAQTRNGSV